MTAANLTALRAALCDYLARKLPQMDFLPGMPCAKQPLPIGRTSAAVDISGIKTPGLQLDGYIGEPTQSALSGGIGRALELAVRIDIYHPDDLALCQDAFAAIAGALLLDSECPLDVLSLSAEPPGYSRADGAFHLAAKAALRAFLSVVEDAAEITDFTIRSDTL